MNRLREMVQTSELFRYRDLFYMLTWRDITIRYKQSFMGIAWALFMPMIIVMTGVVVKTAIAHFSHEPLNRIQLIIVSVKSIPFAFLMSSTRFATSSLTGNSNLVTKIYFPRVIFPAAGISACFFDFLVSSLILAVALSIVGIGASVFLLWVPILVFLMIILVLGAGLFLSVANLFFRDVKYIVEAVMTFAVFLTPVYYEVSVFGKWSSLLMLNPASPLIEGLSQCVVYHRPPDLRWILYSAAVSILLLLSGALFFRKIEPLFAENI